MHTLPSSSGVLYRCDIQWRTTEVEVDVGDRAEVSLSENKYYLALPGRKPPLARSYRRAGHL